MDTTPILTQRRDVGTYMARWRERGRQRAHSFRTKNRRVAKVLFDEWLEQWRAGRAPELLTDGREAVQAFLDYLRDTKGVRDSTIRYNAGVLNPLLDAWEGVPMPQWTRLAFDRYLAKRRIMVPKKAKELTDEDRELRRTRNSQIYKESVRPISNHTKRKTIFICWRFTKWARSRGFDCANFAPDDDLPELPKVRNKSVVTLPELVAVLECARKHAFLEVPIGLASLAALGEGDIVSLDWSEVDLKKGVMEREDGRQKTGEQLRVPLMPQLHDILRREHLRQGRPKSGRVCSRPANSMQASLRRLEARAGLEKPPRLQGGLRRYRRSCNTILMALGAPQPVRAAVMAHAPGSAMTGAYDTVHMREMDKWIVAFSKAFEEARGA